MKVYYVYRNCGIVECEVKKETQQNYIFTSNIHKTIFGQAYYYDVREPKRNIYISIEDAVSELKKRINTSIGGYKANIRSLESSLSTLEKFSEKDHD